MRRISFRIHTAITVVLRIANENGYVVNYLLNERISAVVTAHIKLMCSKIFLSLLSYTAAWILLLLSDVVIVNLHNVQAYVSVMIDFLTCLASLN